MLENVYEGLNSWDCVWRLKCSFQSVFIQSVFLQNVPGLRVFKALLVNLSNKKSEICWPKFMITYDQVWSHMTKYGQIWPDIIKYDQMTTLPVGGFSLRKFIQIGWSNRPLERLVPFQTLITTLTIENPNSWQSLWHWRAFAILAMFPHVTAVIAGWNISQIVNI